MSTHPNMNLTTTVILGPSIYNLTYREVTVIMKEHAAALGLVYTQSNRADNSHWYGIANPLSNILSSFKMRYDDRCFKNHRGQERKLHWLYGCCTVWFDPRSPHSFRGIDIQARKEISNGANAGATNSDDWRLHPEILIEINGWRQ